MLKKVVAVTLGVIVAVYALSHTRFGSYMCTAWKQIRKEADAQVSINFEIDRINTEIAKLDKDIEAQKTVVATQIVEIRELRTEVKTLDEQVVAKQECVGQLLTLLKSGETTVDFGGEKLSEKELTNKYQQELKSGQHLKARYQAKKQLQDAQEQLLDTEWAKLNDLQNQQDELRVEMTLLETEYKKLQAQEARNSVVVSASRLDEIKKSAKNLRKRIEIEKTKQELTQNPGVRPDEKAKTREALIKEGEEFVPQGKGGKVVATDKGK
jgi:chromosome segregation ATPase